MQTKFLSCLIYILYMEHKILIRFFFAIKRYLNCLVDIGRWGVEQKKIEQLLMHNPQGKSFIDHLISEGNGELIHSFMARNFPHHSALIRKELYTKESVKHAVLAYLKTVLDEFIINLALDHNLIWANCFGLSPLLGKTGLY